MLFTLGFIGGLLTGIVLVLAFWVWLMQDTSELQMSTWQIVGAVLLLLLGSAGFVFGLYAAFGGGVR
jgi:hypothetical protein